MKKLDRPHHKCAKCRAAIPNCIYMVFGPCKWVEAEEENDAVRAGEQTARERTRETVQLQIDLLREDDQLALSLKQDNESPVTHDTHKHQDYFPEL